MIEKKIEEASAILQICRRASVIPMIWLLLVLAVLFVCYGKICWRHLYMAAKGLVSCRKSCLQKISKIVPKDLSDLVFDLMGVMRFDNY